MKFTDKQLAEIRERCDAAYRASGKKALEKMSRPERMLLASHYQFELNDVSKRLGAHPGNEVDQARKSRLEGFCREVSGSLMKGKEIDLER